MLNPGRSRQLLVGALLALLAGAGAPPAEAQGIGDRLKRKVTERLDRKVDEAMEKALDAVECVITDTACIEAAQTAGRNVSVVDTDGNPLSSGTGEPGEGVWLNYDFTPGDRVLFYDDFSGGAVGDFPQRLELVNGNFETAERGGVRFLRASSAGEVHIRLPEALPQKFTLEFDIVAPRNDHQIIRFSDDGNAPAVTFRANPNGGEGGIEGGGIRSIARAPDAEPGVLFPVRVMADGQHVKVYIGGTRVANMPNADLGRTDRIRLRLSPPTGAAVLIGNVRVAAGTRDLYEALLETGRVATQGILFDIGSDRLRPESTPTLKQIGDMLAKHRELNITIEGHTDNVGDDAANLNLSQRRAAAVKAYLADKHGIAADRLEAEGLGETKPAATNDTAEGRQQNRRVELVKR